MIDPLDTCVLCPRLCRTACPVATGTGREAAVPTAIATAVWDWRSGRLSREVAAAAVGLCTDCGACEAICHVGRPLPALLMEARAVLLEPQEMEPLAPIVGSGELTVVHSDARVWAPRLSETLGVEVQTWATSDRFGVAWMGTAAWPERMAALRERVGEDEVVAADGGVVKALRSAEIAVRWLHDVIPDLAGGLGSCVAGGERPIACCGGGGPLRTEHPLDAERVARTWSERASSQHGVDSRCREHLRGCGFTEYSDAVDRLLASSDG